MAWMTLRMVLKGIIQRAGNGNFIGRCRVVGHAFTLVHSENSVELRRQRCCAAVKMLVAIFVSV
jgi:hypothetical protein